MTTTAYVWDGDLTELNNPVPGWWTWMFLLACAVALGYLFLMPGLGTYQGLLGYSSADEGAAAGQDGRGRAPDLRASRP
ncbi:cbb3-type cytochrome c oxidase N-terminal domain-containing protein [Achromobacter xylosoxidans]